jgi:hypothetical protein
MVDVIGDNRRLPDRRPVVLAAPQDQPEAAPQVQPEVLLSQDMLQPGGDLMMPLISCKAAHNVMKELRLAYIPGEMEAFDMTRWPLFDWKRFIAQRPLDAVAIIGCGITKFEFRYLLMLDSNTKQRRSDFIAHRADGSGVRLHPCSSGKLLLETGLREAHPVHGNLIDWIPARVGQRHFGEPDWTSFLATTVADHPVPQHHRGAFEHSVSKADLRGRAEANRFLQTYVADWDRAAGRQNYFWSNLSAEAWPWPLWVANEPLASHFRDDAVQAFGVAWKEDPDDGDCNGAVFWGQTVGLRPFHVALHGVRTELHWNWNNIDWRR